MRNTTPRLPSRRQRQPAVMAEPEYTGDHEADRQRDDGLGVDVNQTHPCRRLLETAGFRQIIGEQRHGNAEDGVAQHLKPAHFEKMDLRQWGPRSHQSVVALAELKLRRSASTLRAPRGLPSRSSRTQPAFACRLRRGSLHSLRERRLVRAVGLEPTRRCHRGILSPLRLPVPPRPLSLRRSDT